MESLQNKTNTELIEEIEILQSRLEALEKKNSNLLSTHDSLRENERRCILLGARQKSGDVVFFSFFL